MSWASRSSGPGWGGRVPTNGSAGATGGSRQNALALDAFGDSRPYPRAMGLSMAQGYAAALLRFFASQNVGTAQPEKTSIYCMSHMYWDGQQRKGPCVRGHAVATQRISKMMSYGLDTRSVSVQMLWTGGLGCICYIMAQVFCRMAHIFRVPKLWHGQTRENKHFSYAPHYMGRHTQIYK